MEQNKTGKYFKYAIGEIVLVVIGILIALSINNWNEDRKLRLEEQDLLKRIEREFISNREKITGAIIEQKRVSYGLRKFLELTGPTPPTIINKDSLIQYFKALNYIPKYTPEQGVLTSIIASGKIALIQNTSLNENLTKWPQKYEDYEYEHKIIYDISKNQIMNFMADKFSIRNFQIEGLGNTGISKFPYNPNVILSSMELETYAEFKRVDSDYAIIALEFINKLQEEILTIINQELND